MAATIPDIVVPYNDWLDLNTASGIAVGTAMIIKNKSQTSVRIQEGTTKPDANSTDGEVLTSMALDYAGARVKSNSLKIWVKSVKEKPLGKLTVQSDA